MSMNETGTKFSLRLSFQAKAVQGEPGGPDRRVGGGQGRHQDKGSGPDAAALAEGAGGPPPELPPKGKDGSLRTPHGQLGIQAMVNGRMRMQGDAVTMARLTDTLGIALGRPVVDERGLRGLTMSPSTSLPKAWVAGPRVRRRERAAEAISGSVTRRARVGILNVIHGPHPHSPRPGCE